MCSPDVVGSDVAGRGVGDASGTRSGRRVVDDPRFFEPFRRWFDPTFGRPSIPMETYLRLMFLKYRYRLGFETLCAEVSDSLMWLRFCRIPLGERAPHPSTLMKITTRCGSTTVAELNAHLVAVGVDAGVIDMGWLRADTTVVPADIKYPTDSGLLTKGITRLATPRTGDRERAIAATGVVPDAVTADRGYGQTSVDEALAELGVELVAILRKGQPGKARQQVEAADNFVELVRWRTGAEGRIAALKRQHGWGRARLRSLEGARTWCGWGVLSHNAIKIAALSN